MSGLFGGGSKPPPTPPPVDTQTAMDRVDAMLAEERRKRAASGRASTYLAGETGQASTASRTLLGNL